MICPKCGKDLKENAVFCTNCGNKIFNGLENLSLGELEELKQLIEEDEKSALSERSEGETKNTVVSEVKKPDKKNNALKYIISLLSMLLIASVIFIIYNKINDYPPPIKKNTGNENAVPAVLTSNEETEINAYDGIDEPIAGTTDENVREETEEKITVEEITGEMPLTLEEKYPDINKIEISDDYIEDRINSMFDDINEKINQKDANGAYEIIKLMQTDINNINNQYSNNSYSQTVKKKYTDANKELTKTKQDNCNLFIKLFTDNSMNKDLTDFFPLSQITAENKKIIYPVLAEAYILTGRGNEVERILKDMMNPLTETTLTDTLSFIATLDAKYPQRKKAYNLINTDNYDYIKPFENNVAIVGKNISGTIKWGLIDKDGKIVTEPKYDWMEGFLEGLCAVYLNGKWGFVDISGALVIPVMYDDLYDPANDNLFSAYANPNPEHTKRGFYYGYALVYYNGYWGYINSRNIAIGEGFAYGRSSNFSSDGIASVRKFIDNDSLPYSGLLKSDGTYIIAPQATDSQGNLFRTIRPVYGGFAGANWFTPNNVLSRGIINSAGQIVHTFAVGEYDLIQDFREGLGMVVKNNKIGFVNGNGKQIIAPVFDTATVFINGLAKVSQSGKYGLVKSDGYYASKPEYDEIQDFANGYAVIKKDGKYGFIDSAGKIICAPKYVMAAKFSNDVLPVQINNLWGLTDTKGNEILSAKYEMIGDFDDGLAPAKFGGKWGYIDKSGYFVIEPVFYSASPFTNGVAYVKTKDNKYFLITKN